MDLKTCIVIITRVSYLPERKFGKLNVSVGNDGEHSSTLKFTIHIAVAVLNLKIAASVMMPQDKQDADNSSRRKLM